MSNEQITRQPSEIEKIRIEFLRHVFSNVQELIRLIDQKGSFVLAAVSLFSVAMFTVIGIYLNSQPGTEKYVLAILIFWYLTHAGKTVWHSILVTRARPHALGSKCNAPQLIFPLIIMQRYQGSDANYLRALQQVEPDDIMADYSQQIIENSNIYLLKQHHINKSVEHLLRSVLPWLAVAIIIIVNLFILRLGTVPRIYILLAVAVILLCIDWLLIRKLWPIKSGDSIHRTKIERKGSH